MAKIHWDKLSLVEAINLAKTRGVTIQNIMSHGSENNKSLRLENEKLSDENEKLTNKIYDLEEKIKELRDVLSASVNSGSCECDCNDWVSAGTNPNNGDKYKQCLDCGLVSVR